MRQPSSATLLLLLFFTYCCFQNFRNRAPFAISKHAHPSSITIAAALSYFLQLSLQLLSTTTTTDIPRVLENILDKSYGTDEEFNRRKHLFDASRAAVIEQNKLYEAGRSTWWAKINKFSNWTPEEHAQMRMKNFQPEPITESTKMFAAKSLGKNPPKKSWMDVQTPVKNQGACGSCWTFASTECVESHLAIAEGISKNSSKPLEILAPQTLVNCVKNPNECGGTGVSIWQMRSPNS